MAKLRSTTKINQFTMFLQWLSYDLKPRSTSLWFILWLSYDLRLRSTNSLCFFSGWDRMYDQLASCFERLSYYLRPRLTNSLCFQSGWVTIYDQDQPIRYGLSVAELRSTTQINQFAMFLQWLSYNLLPRSTILQCFFSGWATIYDPDQPICNVF